MNKPLPCGCIVEVELTGYGQVWSGVDIEYCPKHAAVDDILEALGELLAITDRPDIGDLWYFIGDDLYFLDGVKDANKKAQAAKAQATVQD